MQQSEHTAVLWSFADPPRWRTTTRCAAFARHTYIHDVAISASLPNVIDSGCVWCRLVIQSDDGLTADNHRSAWGSQVHYSTPRVSQRCSYCSRRPLLPPEISVLSVCLPSICLFLPLDLVFTHRRSVAGRGGCFQRRLFVCQSVCPFGCQHDNFRTIERRKMKLGS